MDFNDFMACCSANYQRLHRLLSRLPIGSDCFTLPIGTAGQFQLKTIRKQAYTDTLSIQFETVQTYQWLAKLDLEVKVYHDAQLVEVSACRDPHGTMQNFSQASSHKHFPYWEKWQINQLLTEILSHLVLTKET